MSSRRSHPSTFVLVALIVLTIATTSTLAQNARPSRPAAVRGVELSAPVTPFVFDGDLRDLAPPTPWGPGDPVKEIPRRFYPEPGTMIVPNYLPGVDPLLEQQLDWSVTAINAFTAPTRSFPGQGYSGVNPPDTVGEVGPNHYIQMINAGGGATVVIYDKS